MEDIVGTNERTRCWTDRTFLS